MMAGEEICNLALNYFKSSPKLGSREGARQQQSYVEWKLFDCQGKVENAIAKLTNESIQEAMAKLASNVNEDVIFLNLEIPTRLDVATSSEFLRFLITYCITDDSYLVRFDVLFELA